MVAFGRCEAVAHHPEVYDGTARERLSARLTAFTTLIGLAKGRAPLPTGTQSKCTSLAITGHSCPCANPKEASSRFLKQKQKVSTTKQSD
jgi:hypothetical protein